MVRQVQSVLNSIFEGAGDLTQTHWILLSAVVVVVGFFSLRGFTERI